MWKILVSAAIIQFLLPQYSKAAPPNHADATLYINSGLADPTWPLDAVEIYEVLNRIGVAIPTQTPGDPSPTPARKGVIGVAFSPVSSQFPASILVLHGTINIFQANGSKGSKSDDRGLRPYLVNSAIRHGVVISDRFRGDLNDDGIIDQADIDILLKDKGKPFAQSTCGVRCDFDGDGMITVLDARKLSLMCSYPHCASHR